MCPRLLPDLREYRYKGGPRIARGPNLSKRAPLSAWKGLYLYLPHLLELHPIRLALRFSAAGQLYYEGRPPTDFQRAPRNRHVLRLALRCDN